MNDLGFRLPENRAAGAGVVALQRHAGTAGKGTHGTGSTRARRMAASPLLGSVKQTLRLQHSRFGVCFPRQWVVPRPPAYSTLRRHLVARPRRIRCRGRHLAVLER